MLKLKINESFVEVRQNDKGLFCLNDIFRASGFGDNKKPSKFLRGKIRDLSQEFKIYWNDETGSKSTYADIDTCRLYVAWLGLEQEGMHVIKPRYKRKEDLFSELLISAFPDKGFIRQYPVLNYKVDFYSPPSNLAVEYDECHHRFQIEKDYLRMQEIIAEKDCHFIRVKEEQEGKGLIDIYEFLRKEDN